MKIALTYNLKKKDSLKPADYFSECDSEATINSLVSALKNKGHSVEAVDVEYPNFFSYFRKNRVDMVFNIAEGKHGRFRAYILHMEIIHKKDKTHSLYRKRYFFPGPGFKQDADQEDT